MAVRKLEKALEKAYGNFEKETYAGYPVYIVEGSELPAYAVFEENTVVCSREMWNVISTKKGAEEILLHEIEHLKRGVIDIHIDDLSDWRNVGVAYYKEEQAINKAVAPTLYGIYEDLDPRDPEMIRGGLLALNVSKLNEYLGKFQDLPEEVKGWIERRKAQLENYDNL